MKFQEQQRKAKEFVISKIAPLERDYVRGKIGIDEFFNKLNPLQDRLMKILAVLPVIKSTLRYAKPGENFVTETLMKRIRNFEPTEEIERWSKKGG